MAAIKSMSAVITTGRTIRIDRETDRDDKGWGLFTFTVGRIGKANAFTISDLSEADAIELYETWLANTK